MKNLLKNVTAVLAGLLLLSGASLATAEDIVRTKVWTEATSTGWEKFVSQATNNGLFTSESKAFLSSPKVAAAVCGNHEIKWATKPTPTFIEACEEKFLTINGLHRVVIYTKDFHEKGLQGGGFQLPTEQEILMAIGEQKVPSTTVARQPPSPEVVATEVSLAQTVLSQAQAVVKDMIKKGDLPSAKTVKDLGDDMKNVQLRLGEAQGSDEEMLKAAGGISQAVVGILRLREQEQANVLTTEQKAVQKAELFASLEESLFKAGGRLDRMKAEITADVTRDVMGQVDQKLAGIKVMTPAEVDNQIDAKLENVKTMTPTAVESIVEDKFSAVWLAIGAVAVMLLAVFFYARSGNRRSKKTEVEVFGDGKEKPGLVEKVDNLAQKVGDVQVATGYYEIIFPDDFDRRISSLSALNRDYECELQFVGKEPARLGFNFDRPGYVKIIGIDDQTNAVAFGNVRTTIKRARKRLVGMPATLQAAA